MLDATLGGGGEAGASISVWPTRRRQRGGDLRGGCHGLGRRSWGGLLGWGWRGSGGRRRRRGRRFRGGTRRWRRRRRGRRRLCPGRRRRGRAPPSSLPRDVMVRDARGGGGFHRCCIDCSSKVALPRPGLLPKKLKKHGRKYKVSLEAHELSGEMPYGGGCKPAVMRTFRQRLSGVCGFVLVFSFTISVVICTHTSCFIVIDGEMAPYLLVKVYNRAVVYLLAAAVQTVEKNDQGFQAVFGWAFVSSIFVSGQVWSSTFSNWQRQQRRIWLQVNSKKDQARSMTSI